MNDASDPSVFAPEPDPILIPVPFSVPDTMRALQFHAPGPPDVLCVEEVPVPRPGPGELLVRVGAAGLNFADTERRRGSYDPPSSYPYRLGSEAAGVVVAVGEGADVALLGQRVVALGKGCCAEYALADAAAAAPLPDDVDDVTAAALPVQGLTALHMLGMGPPLGPGHAVLVHSAAGGVGTLLVQLAYARGADVIAAVSTEAKAELARALGARVALLYGAGDFSADVRRLRDGRGVDVVYDAVGRATFAQSLASLAPFGRLILYGSASGHAPALDPEVLFERSLTLSAYWLR
ncbi:MAG TPA: zinc-binding dehydrogenase, partial [Polyangiaceae bacterium]|nr:zinc-binding dehydrogenase [Polyangiaceae bacterium]